MQVVGADAGSALLSNSSANSRRLAAILCLAVLVRIAFAAGYQGQDDKHYIFYAATLALDGRVPIEVPNLWVARIGNWLPIAASFRLFGMSEWVACIYAMLCSVGSVALVFFTGRVLVGERAALVAALLAAVFPLDACYATTAFVDLPVAFFMLLALHQVIVGQRSGSSGRFFLAGLAAGWAYMCRETALLILIPFGVYFLVWRWSWKHLRAIVAGVLVLLAGELVFWGSVAGDPLHNNRLVGDTVQEEMSAYMSDAPASTRDRVSGWLPRPEPRSARRSSNSVLDFALMFTTNEEFGLFWALGWPLILYRIARRRTDLWELIVWIVSIALLLGFYPRYFPYTLPRDPRYYACLTGPIVLLIAHHAMRWPVVARWLTVSALVATSLLGLVVTQPARAVRVERTFVELLADYRDRELYLSPELTSFLTVYSGVPRPTGVTIHLLEEGDQSDSWHSVRALWPDAPFVRRSSQIGKGYVAFYGALLAKPGTWRQIEVVRPPAPRFTSSAISLLQAVGVPERLVYRLLPGHGRSIHLYAVE